MTIAVRQATGWSYSRRARLLRFLFVTQAARCQHCPRFRMLKEWLRCGRGMLESDSWERFSSPKVLIFEFNRYHRASILMLFEERNSDDKKSFHVGAGSSHDRDRCASPDEYNRFD